MMAKKPPAITGKKPGPISPFIFSPNRKPSLKMIRPKIKRNNELYMSRYFIRSFYCPPVFSLFNKKLFESATKDKRHALGCGVLISGSNEILTWESLLFFERKLYIRTFLDYSVNEFVGNLYASQITSIFDIKHFHSLLNQMSFNFVLNRQINLNQLHSLSTPCESASC